MFEYKKLYRSKNEKDAESCKADGKAYRKGFFIWKKWKRKDYNY